MTFNPDWINALWGPVAAVVVWAGRVEIALAKRMSRENFDQGIAELKAEILQNRKESRDNDLLLTGNFIQLGLRVERLSTLVENGKKSDAKTVSLLNRAP